MDPPGELRIDALNTTTPNLADEPTLANGPPTGESRIDTLNTATPNLANKPTLANGPPQMHHGIYIIGLFGSHFGFFKKRCKFPFISELLGY